MEYMAYNTNWHANGCVNLWMTIMCNFLLAYVKY